MRIAFVTVSLSRKAGGLFTSIRCLAQTLQRDPAVDVQVLGIEDEYSTEDLPQWSPLSPIACRPLGPRAFSYSPDLVRTLARTQPDLAHTQGLWMARSFMTSSWAKRTGRPYMVSPRGMLDPWALRASRWKKRIAGVLFERTHLHRAACIHALNEAEAQAIRSYGLRTPICVVPNGIHLPDDGVCGIGPCAAPPWDGRLPDDAKVLLYIGRLHPKKGLPQLLEAWAAARIRGAAVARPWHLCIGGWDQVGHLGDLRTRCELLKATGSVHFLGPLYGGAKDAALRHASGFILPSLSEGLPMAVLEAWAYRLPVLMTPFCNLPAGFERGASLRIEPAASSIAAGLLALFEMSAHDRTAMGERGRRLVERRFQWPGVAAEMRGVYDWVLGGGSPPSAVRLT